MSIGNGVSIVNVLVLGALLQAVGEQPARAAGPAAAGPPPNIVFIVADDLGVNDLFCYGRKDQPTPQMDKLAQQGVRFATAYAAQSVCSPTRAALMTGKSPARLHLTTFLPGRPDAPSQLLLHPKIEQQLPLKEQTIAELLKPAGYASICLGKWHLGGKGFLPTDQGFDEYFPGHATTKPTATEGGKGEYELTAHAEKFIETHKDRPFFLYIGHNTPHIPFAVRPELAEKHKDAFNPIYAATIESLDDCVGRVVARIDALGLADRTLIVFTSDNGGLHILEGDNTPATHNTPFRAGKGFCYEGGVRIPLIARWTGKLKPGTVVDTPVISTDWVPSLLAFAGVTTGGPFDGVSLAGLLLRGEPLAPRPLYWHLPHYTNQGSRPSGAIRDGNWKLIEHYEDGRCELFDLGSDTNETTDLAEREPGRIAELRGKLEKWRREMAVQENTANRDFNARPWRQLYHQDVDASRLPLESTAAAMAEKLTAWRATMNAVLPPAPNRSPMIAPGAGAILLHARDAKVHGVKLRYEPEPHKDTLGYWVEPDDWLEWEFAAPQAGEFEVELLQGCGKGSGNAEIEVSVAGQTFSMQVQETGHFQRFIPRTIGTVKLEKPGRYTLSVRVKKKPNVAVMDLRRVTLRSVP